MFTRTAIIFSSLFLIFFHYESTSDMFQPTNAPISFNYSAVEESETKQEFSKTPLTLTMSPRVIDYMRKARRRKRQIQANYDSNIQSELSRASAPVPKDKRSSWLSMDNEKNEYENDDEDVDDNDERYPRGNIDSSDEKNGDINSEENSLLRQYGKRKAGNDRACEFSSFDHRDARQGPKMWDQWGKWSRCTITCGVGKLTRWRHCVAGGCSIGEKEAQFKTCRHEPKIWDQWGKWSCCSVSCGVGKITRWRHCMAGGCASGQKEAQLRACRIMDCR